MKKKRMNVVYFFQYDKNALSSFTQLTGGWLYGFLTKVWKIHCIIFGRLSDKRKDSSVICRFYQSILFHLQWFAMCWICTLIFDAIGARPDLLQIWNLTWHFFVEVEHFIIYMNNWWLCFSNEGFLSNR